MKGFVTLAVGDEKYYKLAANLLKSYRRNSDAPVPFAIIADRQNEFTEQFDKVVLLEKTTCSYMDKLEMLNHPPFDENIFIDADCLIYGDINRYWKYFPAGGGVTCFGKALPLSSHNGWFEIDDIGEYKSQINFIPQLHGGIIFFRDDDLTKSIYLTALTIVKQYSRYRFKYFSTPADEPVLALSMAVYNSKPIQLPEGERERAFLFLPVVKKFRSDIRKGKLCYLSNDGKWVDNVLLLHWQNVNTEKPKYRIESRRLNEKVTAFSMTLWIPCCYALYFIKVFLLRIRKRLLRRI